MSHIYCLHTHIHTHTGMHCIADAKNGGIGEELGQDGSNQLAKHNIQ